MDIDINLNAWFVSNLMKSGKGNYVRKIFTLFITYNTYCHPLIGLKARHSNLPLSASLSVINLLFSVMRKKKSYFETSSKTCLFTALNRQTEHI